MKKISILALFCTGFLFCIDANAGYNDEMLRKEVAEGVDIYTAKTNVYEEEDAAPGELGMEVYQTLGNVTDNRFGIYTPTGMYVRAGGGMNLSFPSEKVSIGNQSTSLSNSWTIQMGLGWNLSSYVRTEFDFQTQKFGISDNPDALATTRGVGGTLFFDFARRYVISGDVIRRRTFVPFMGLGSGIGNYGFEGIGGTGGGFVAPRAIFGLNVMLNDLVGVDLSYQYQMFIGNGFGWNTSNGGVQSLSDLMLSLRMNF